MKTKLIKFVFFIFCLVGLNTNAYGATNNVASLSFYWPVPVGLNVFQRDDYVWVVFDKKKSFDKEEIQKSLKIFNPEVLEIPHSKASILRIKPNTKVSLHVRKEGYLWIVDFVEGDNQFETSSSLKVLVERDVFDNPYVFVVSPNFSEKISVIDPEIGDFITIFASNEPSEGGLKYYDFVDFDFLNSTQGVAIVSDVDDLAAFSGNTGLSVKSLGEGLNVSEDWSLAQQEALVVDNLEEKPLFDFNVLSSLLDKPFLEAESFFKKDIWKSLPEEKNEARMELAKFYLHKGLGFEALAVIDNVLYDDKSTLDKGYVYSLRAVANFIENRYDEALNDLFFVDAGKEKDLWQYLVNMAKVSDVKTEDLPKVLNAIKNYPLPIVTKLSLIATEVAIKNRDDLRAQNIIDVLNKTVALDKRIAPHLNYLIAQNLYVQGYNQEALRQLDVVIASPSQEYSSLARFDKANLSYKLKSLSLDNAITELERVKFAWGDKLFKKNVYKTLSDLYVKNKDYPRAIKLVVFELNLSDEKDKKVVNAKLMNLFNVLYLDHYVDEASPLQALGVFSEYLDYIKKSKNYIDIVINVADRYVAVDLMDNALSVLENALSDKSTTLEQKYKIGTRLALLYASNDEDEKVLKVLEDTQFDNGELKLDDYRGVLKAGVYKNKGDYITAIDILKGNYSKLAVLLRSEIYFKNGDWHLLSSELKSLIETPVEGQALTDEQAKHIFDWFVALNKSGRDAVLTRARAKLMPWFENTKYFSTFDVLTSQFDYDEVDIKDIEDRISNMESYSDFSDKITKRIEAVAKVEEDK